MPWPDSANTALSRLVAAAADLCRRPLRHGVVLESGEDDLDCSLRLEVRSAEGERLESEDLDLEIYRSGDAVHLTLAWQQDDTRPMLWQGEHPLWMDPQGRRCERPQDGLPIEALARRLRALLVPLNPAVDP
ncbi:MAG: hypothetical protein ACK522_04840 [Synechococcaceae cyanobacterium]